MIVEQGPGVAIRLGFRQKQPESGEEIVPVLIVKENGALFDPSDDDVLQQTGDIDAGLSRHGG